MGLLSYFNRQATPIDAMRPKVPPPVTDHVELDRNFVPIADDGEPDLAIGGVWGRKYGGWLDWPKVLDHERVVLLAEAQSGKTEEFKHTAAQLRDRGNAAFYATIEQLADGRFRLDPAERASFDAWQRDGQRAWFFLIPSMKRRLNRKKLDDALRQLAGEIGPAMGRANILVSCRVSDWKGKADRQTIREVLPLPNLPPAAPVPTSDPDAELLDAIFERKEAEQPKKKEDDENKKPDVVVRLVPLTDDQRRSFALAKGVRDIEAFMEAVERQGLDAWPNAQATWSNWCSTGKRTDNSER